MTFTETPNSSPQNGVATTGILLVLSGTLNRDIQAGLALAPGVPMFINTAGQLDFNEAALTGFQCGDLAACSITSLMDVTLNGAQNDLHILYYDPAGQQWRNIYFPEFLALALGVPGQIIPGVPTAGPPVRLVFDPGTGTFGWQPA